MNSSRGAHGGKYEIGLDFILPDLGTLLPSGGRIEQEDMTQRSVYYDTAARDLLRQHLTLRRRTDDTGLGWQLTVPADKTPTEIGVPSGDGDTVPEELASWVAGVARGNPVHPVITLTTVRHTHRLLDGDARLLVQVADDVVHGTVAGNGAVATEWREITVEPGEVGAKKMLKALGNSLTRSGGRPSRYPSTLSRALADRHRADDQQKGDDDTDTSRWPAARVLTDYLEAQVQAIVAGDVWLRRGLDPVHPTRVGIRRFRSTLRVFGNLFEPTAAATLGTELSWYAGLLGEVRDRQVQRVRFAHAVTTLPSELVMGPVAARIEEDLFAEQLHHLTEVRTALDGERYRTLLATLARWRTTPPLTDAAADPGAIRAALRRAERKALKRVAAVVESTDEEALRRARRTTERARYGAELARPVLGKKKAKKKVARYKTMQEVLVECQDSVVAAGILRGLGARAGSTPGENGFTFGLLYGLELQAARQARLDAARLIV